MHQTTDISQCVKQFWSISGPKKVGTDLGPNCLQRLSADIHVYDTGIMLMRHSRCHAILYVRNNCPFVDDRGLSLKFEF